LDERSDESFGKSREDWEGEAVANVLGQEGDDSVWVGRGRLVVAVLDVGIKFGFSLRGSKFGGESVVHSKNKNLTEEGIHRVLMEDGVELVNKGPELGPKSESGFALIR
jgi:hypothetical protein